MLTRATRSTNLTKIATKHQPHAAVVADNLMLPHQGDRFDFAISIAVVHHLSTPERRVEAIDKILETLRPGSSSSANTEGDVFDGGRALIYVWALEQKESRRGWDEGHEQDVMVPWVMKRKDVEPTTFNRYYHLYRKGELEQDILKAGGLVLESGYEKDNWWAIVGKQPN